MKSQTKKKKTKIGESNNRLPDKFNLDQQHGTIYSNSMVLNKSRIETEHDS